MEGKDWYTVQANVVFDVQADSEEHAEEIVRDKLHRDKDVQDFDNVKFIDE